MPPVPERSSVPAGRAVANDYDSFAEAYSAMNEASLINAHYERPALLDLAGDVAGRRILDAGCGSGPLTAAPIAAIDVDVLDLRVAQAKSDGLGWSGEDGQVARHARHPTRDRPGMPG